jgi:hypothetical protein
MSKILLGAAVGVFAGALVVELLHRMQPGMFGGVGEGLGSGLSKFGSSLSEAFKAGYEGVERKQGDSAQTAPPSVAPAT